MTINSKQKGKRAVTFGVCYDIARNSPNKRMMPLAKAAVVKNFRRVVGLWMASAGIRPDDLPKCADVSLVVRRGRRLDDDNARACCKPLLDSIWTQDKDVRIVDVHQEIGQEWRGREEIIVTVRERKGK